MNTEFDYHFYIQCNQRYKTKCAVTVSNLGLWVASILL